MQFHYNLVQILQFLVEYGENFCQSIDESGNTPLHIASEHGNLEAVKILLDHGASGDAQNHKLAILLRQTLKAHYHPLLLSVPIVLLWSSSTPDCQSAIETLLCQTLPNCLRYTLSLLVVHRSSNIPNSRNL